MPRKHEEDTLQIQLANLLTWATKVLWFHVPNGGARSAITAAILKAMGTKAGVADLLFFPPPTCTLHALELKSKGKKPRDSQLEFKAKVIEAGGKYEYADNWEDAVAILKTWRVLR